MNNNYVVSFNQIRLNSLDGVNVYDQFFFKDPKKEYSDTFFYLYNEVIGYNLLEFDSLQNKTFTMDFIY